MRFTVKCNHCGRTFLAETQQFGRIKYRCPYCQSVVTCQFDAPKDFYTQARSVIPVADVTAVTGQQAMPMVKSRLLHLPTTEQFTQAKEALTHEYKKRQAGFVGTLNWIWGHLSVFCLWSSGKIRRFQDEYEDGDLWVFFTFSFLFVLFVILGLISLAEITKVIAASNSWLFKQWLQVKQMF